MDRRGLVMGAFALGALANSSDVSAQVAGGPKVGFVDTDRILSEVEVVKQKREELSQAKEKAEADLQQKLADLNQRMRDLKAKEEVLRPDAYEKQRAELDKELIDWRASRRQKETDLADLYRETIRPIRNQINQVVEQIAKEEGFGLIFFKETLAYGAPQYDITEKVIARLNR